jgi:hypothetical protein
VLLGTYLTLSTAATVGFFALVTGRESIPLGVIYFILGTLAVVGIVVLWTITVYRGWHAQYTNVCISISLAYERGDPNIFEAARSLIADPTNRYEYFSPWGVEFRMFLLALFIWEVTLFALIYIALVNNSLPMWLALLITSLLVLVGGSVGWITHYKAHVIRRQERFPYDSWLILKPAAAQSRRRAGDAEKHL